MLEELALYCQSLYREQDRAAAGEQFADRQKLSPDRSLYVLYVGRVNAFREHPPGRAWDGAFTIKTK